MPSAGDHSQRDHPGVKGIIPKHHSPPYEGAVVEGVGREKSGRGSFPEPVILAQLATIARWYCEGVPFNEMCRLLNINKDTVGSRMNVLREEWQRSREDYNARKDEELVKLDNLEREAWEAWYRSCAERVVTQLKMEPSAEKTGPHEPTPPPHVVSQVVRRENRDGNPAFLEMVFRCIDRRVKMLGMDAPVRIQSDVTLRALAAQIAEAEGLNERDILEEAERIFQATVKQSPTE